ncbi:MAG: hypothetical protein Q9184_002339 [Pyrenodesmia sp. 2 TL-2023]
MDGLDPVEAGRESDMNSAKPPSVAAIEARYAQKAKQHGYDSWDEYQEALEQREEEQWIADTTQAKERGKRGEDKISPTALTSLSTRKEPEPALELWYLPERCCCRGLSLKTSVSERNLIRVPEHLTQDFCPGNLTSPAESEDWSCGLNEEHKAALENLKIKEGEPSKRLSDEELYRYSPDDEDDIYLRDLDQGLAQDELTQWLLDQRRESKRGGRHPLASEWHATNVETLPKSYIDSPIPAYANHGRGGSPEVGQTESIRPNVEVEVDIYAHEARNASEASATTTAGPPEKKKRPLDAPEARQNKDKQRKIDLGAAIISMQSRSQLDPPTSSDRSMTSTLETPGALQDENKRIRADPNLGVVSPQNTAESSSTTCVSQRQKRIRDEPVEEQDQRPLNKRIRMISDAEKETQTNIMHDHHRRYRNRQRQHPSANLPRTFPRKLFPLILMRGIVLRIGFFLKDPQAQAASTPTGSGEAPQLSPDREVRQPKMPEHPLVTADQHENEQEQSSRNHQQDGDPEAPAVVEAPKPTRQANPTTPTRMTNRNDLNEPMRSVIREVRYRYGRMCLRVESTWAERNDPVVVLKELIRKRMNAHKDPKTVKKTGPRIPNVLSGYCSRVRN